MFKSLAMERESSYTAGHKQQSVTTHKVEETFCCKVHFRNNLLGNINSIFCDGCSIGETPLYIGSSDEQYNLPPGVAFLITLYLITEFSNSIDTKIQF